MLHIIYQGLGMLNNVLIYHIQITHRRHFPALNKSKALLMSLNSTSWV